MLDTQCPRQANAHLWGSWLGIASVLATVRGWYSKKLSHFYLVFIFLITYNPDLSWEKA